MKIGMKNPSIFNTNYHLKIVYLVIDELSYVDVKVRFSEKRQTVHPLWTAVAAVLALVVPMYTAKRPRSGSKTDLDKDLKEACKVSKVPFRFDQEEPSAKRFLPNTPA